MRKFEDIQVRYTHPAIPPIGIEIDKTYIVKHLSSEHKMDKSVIKDMFTPIDVKWDDLDGIKEKAEIKKDKSKGKVKQTY